MADLVNSRSSAAAALLPPPVTEADFRRILGIRFYVGEVGGLLELTKRGGLIAVPSAPVLTRLPEDSAHREAVEGCDFAITDSGFMVLLWWVLKRERLIRISGLRYLQALIQLSDFRHPSSAFWVMPTREDATANVAWLADQGIPLAEDHVYLAPMYSPGGALRDDSLLVQLEKIRPPFVVLCIGGGVQERLGYFLRKNLSYQPALICTGAAIAFLSGRQTRIPQWADRVYLGWLFRLLSNPRGFFPRCVQAMKLPWLLVRHGEKSASGG